MAWLNSDVALRFRVLAATRDADDTLLVSAFAAAGALFQHCDPASLASVNIVALGSKLRSGLPRFGPVCEGAGCRTS